MDINGWFFRIHKTLFFISRQAVLYVQHRTKGGGGQGKWQDETFGIFWLNGMRGFEKYLFLIQFDYV